MDDDRQPLRINGTVNRETDAVLYDVLAAIPNKRRRMSRLRQLALLGLMVEQRQLSTNGLSSIPTQAPAALTSNQPPTSERGQRPGVVTANTQTQTTKHVGNADKSGQRVNRALMARANMRLLD